MDRHPPDRIALVFGLMFTSVGVVSLAGLANVVEVDAGVAVGAGLVLAALLVIVVTVTNLRDRAAIPGTD